MTAPNFIDELRVHHKDESPYSDLVPYLTEAEIERWRGLQNWSRSQFFQEVAIFLAFGFNASELSFEFCDAVVNCLFMPYVETAKPKSELFWDVYLAFDEGEYYHGNDRSRDPVDVYTRPQIAAIVEDLKHSYGTP